MDSGFWAYINQPLWPGSDTLGILWDEWLGANENWKKSTYAIRLKKTHSHEKIGARRWMTFKQLVAKYEDKEVAESIKAAKKTILNSEIVMWSAIQIALTTQQLDCSNQPSDNLHI